MRPLALALALALGNSASAGLILSPITGQDGLEGHFGTDPFDPNNTGPELQLTGIGSVENTGGVAVFSVDEFILDVLFLGNHANESKVSFQKLMVTAAFEPVDASFEKLRFFDPEDPGNYVDILSGEFVDSEELGLMFPPDGSIRGIGSGAGNFLSLDGALMAAVDLGVGLERDPMPPSASLGVEVYAPSPDLSIRFDVFGLNTTPGSGWNVEGNNPNSGAAGVRTTGGGGDDPFPDPTPGGGLVPEPTTLLLFGPGAAALIAYRRRRQRRRAR
jgi:hypothetical protein